MAVFRAPVVLLKRANAPVAVFCLPVVLFKSAAAPVAVFSTPAPELGSPTLARSAPAPTAVLNWPSVSLLSDKKPTAVLNVPVVRLKRAAWPSAVFPPGYPPSGAGLTAWAPGKRATHIRTNGIRINVHRNGEVLIGLLIVEGVVFIQTFLFFFH